MQGNSNVSPLGIFMTFFSSLMALCEMIGSQTGAEVILGLPDEEGPGIYVWPWRLDEKPEFKNMTPGTNSGLEKPTVNSVVIVHFLVLVRPSLTVDGLSQLEATRQAIFDHPVLDVAGNRVRLFFEHLDPQTLTALFTAASIPLTICLSAAIESVQTYE
jgi:hypothetical protein